MRVSTWLTRPLQILVIAYLVIGLVIGWDQELPAINGYFSAGKQSEAAMAITVSVVTTFVTALVVFGSLRRRPWAFGGFLALEGIGIVFEIQGGQPRTTVAFLSDVIGAVVLAVSLIALIRFGPWAMRWPSERAAAEPRA